MNRRIGLSAARVERQLDRAADAIEEAAGQRPAVPAHDTEADGVPHWDLHDDTLVYALRDRDHLVWRWETDSVDTLAFWAMRDATFRLAQAAEGDDPDDEEGRRARVRARWADLLGAASPQWRTRHEAWLAASDASGMIGWPNPAEVVAVIDRLAAKLAADAGQPHPYLPGVVARDDAQPWIETHGDELRYRVRAGERDLRDDRTTDIAELLFLVFEPVTREMARAGTQGDWRGRWLELMTMVNPAWEERVRERL